MSKREKERITEEIKNYEGLENPHIIKLIKAWKSRDKDQVVIITELMTCSLKEYINKFNYPRLRVIKSWSRAILEGLKYLHSRTPPIIHRDIKCDNIFVSSSTGEIKIGDLGLATCLTASHLESQVGTPYFMAPEMFEERYGPSVDIYAFGLCLIEIITSITPYSECKNHVSLYKKISSAQKPDAFYKILDSQVREFVELCISPVDSRPYAAELLNHSFFSIEDESLLSKPVAVLSDKQAQSKILDLQVKLAHPNYLEVCLKVDNGNNTKSNVDFEINLEEDNVEDVLKELAISIELSQEDINLICQSIEQNNYEEQKTPLENLHIASQFTPHFQKDNTIKIPIKVGIQDGETLKKVLLNIEYDLDNDSPEVIAEETVEHFELDPGEAIQISRVIKHRINEILGNDTAPQTPSSFEDLLELYDTKPNPGTAELHQVLSSSNSSNFSSEYAKQHALPEETHKTPPESFSFASLKSDISRKKKNDTEEVSLLQRALGWVFGIKVKVNGVYCVKNEKLVKIFQEEMGIDVTGVVCKDTWTNLMSKF